MAQRQVDVGVERLARWVDGFTERHGPTELLVGPEVTTLTGTDEARAWIETPFPPLVGDTLDDLIAHVTARRCVAVVLVRRSGHAAGLFEGADLIASKVGSSYVQGTTKAGGWSQQRYARRRSNQAEAAFAHAADAAARVLAEARPDALVAGGDRDAVRSVLADRRLAHLPEPSGPWLAVKDPKLKVLASTPGQFRVVSVRLDP